ncbi:unnamed protein product [Sphagnum troendelagicum]
MLHHRIINPLFERTLIRIVKLICKECNYFSAQYADEEMDLTEKENEVIMGSKKYECLNPVVIKAGKSHLLPTKVKILTDRSHSDLSEYGIQRGSEAKGKILVDDSLYKILDGISDDQAERFGFIEGSHPRDLLMSYIPVIPPMMRPEIEKGNPIKEIYERILKANKEYSEKNLSNRAYSSSKMESYQSHIHSLMARLIGLGSNDDSKKMYIKHLLSGKEGHFRKTMLSKRVNMCLRSVATSDPFCNLQDVNAPLEFVEAVKATENIGCDFDEGSYVILNRQPTLSKHSMLTFKIRSVHSKKTISFNPLASKPFNADFDGDEVNIHILTSEDSLKEGEEIMAANKCLKYSMSSSPTFTLIQDAMAGVYILSKKTTLVPESIFSMCMGFKCKDDDYHSFMIRLVKSKRKYKTEEECQTKYTGSALLSAVFPKDFSYYREAQADDETDGDIVIKNGILISGTIDSKVMNESNPRSGILNSMIDKYEDGSVVCDFLTNVQGMITTWFSSRALTIGVDDCYLPEDQRKSTKEMIQQSVDESMAAINDEFDGYSDQAKEATIYNSMMSQRNKFLDEAKKKSEVHSGLEEILYSGSKGNFENAVQIKIMLGQQAIGDSRPKDVTVHFKDSPTDLRARGLCMKSLSEGLDIMETFTHAQAGRYSLIISGMQTPETGYTQRLLVKYLQNLRTCSDGAVRHINSSIVQMTPGRYYIDPSKMYNENDPLNVASMIKNIKKMRNMQ